MLLSICSTVFSAAKDHGNNVVNNNGRAAPVVEHREAGLGVGTGGLKPETSVVGGWGWVLAAPS